MESEGLFGFDGDLQSEVLNFVLHDNDPEEALAVTKRLYSMNGFLLEARKSFGKANDGDAKEYKLDIHFMSHPREWATLLDGIPEGPKGEMMRQKIVERLFLPFKVANLEQGAFDYKEDPIQAIRVFTEIHPTSSEERNAQVEPHVLNLLRLLAGASPEVAVHASDGTISGYRGFPSKPTKLKTILVDDADIKLYQELYDAKINGGEALSRFLSNHPELETPADVQQADLPQLLERLHLLTDYYQKESGAAKTWINQYATEPIKAAKLVSAWQSRALALTHRDSADPGFRVADTPKTILDFVASHGVRLLAESKIKANTTVLTEDDVHRYKDWIDSIGSRYSPATTVGALERAVLFKMQNGPYPQKIIPEGSTSITIDDWKTASVGGEHMAEHVESRSFTASILGPTDSGGFTIGYDTGCCMTLGGASESCIWAGYEDPRYSFFTVRDADDRLRAQSVMYLTKEMGKTYLVVDNIEVNGGTDVTKVAEVYRQALLKILSDKGVEVDAIHVGTGYVQEGILDSLPPSSVAPRTPLPGVYTDARVQRILWSRE